MPRTSPIQRCVAGLSPPKPARRRLQENARLKKSVLAQCHDVNSIREGDLTPPKESWGDRIHAIMRAGISAIPVVGGAGIEVFNALIVPPIIQRRDEWMKEVGEKLLRLEDEKKISFNELKNNQAFVDSVLQATQAVIRSHQQAKREALRNAVLNSALPGPPDSSTQLMFISFVDRFTEWHIRILELFNNPPKWASQHGITLSETPTGGLRQILIHAFPELKERQPFYRQVWADLYSCGLLNT